MACGQGLGEREREGDQGRYVKVREEGQVFERQSRLVALRGICRSRGCLACGRDSSRVDGKEEEAEKNTLLM